MNTEMIMCSSPLNKRKPDECYESEYAAASKFTKVHLFDINDLESINLPKTDDKRLIYHGWMMKPEYYREFWTRCCTKYGYELINSPKDYIQCHHFNEWYPLIEDLTPKSIIVDASLLLRTIAETVLKFMMDNACDVIIKDYVKSLKHNWNEACYIPFDNSSYGEMFFKVAKVIETFLRIKREHNDLQGNLVVRKFVPLKQIGEHNKSKMPLTKEFRSFVKDQKIIHTSKYWDQGVYEGDGPPQEFLDKIVAIIGEKSNLYTFDTAQLQDDSWTCIEVGDGQVSAVPEQEDRTEFFRKLLTS